MCSWHTKQYFCLMEYARPKNFNHHACWRSCPTKWFLRFHFNFSLQCDVHRHTFTSDNPPHGLPSINNFRPFHWLILWCFCNNFFTTQRFKQQIFSSTISPHLAMRCKWLMITVLFFHGIARPHAHFFFHSFGFMLVR